MWINIDLGLNQKSIASEASSQAYQIHIIWHLLLNMSCSHTFQTSQCSIQRFLHIILYLGTHRISWSSALHGSFDGDLRKLEDWQKSWLKRDNHHDMAALPLLSDA